MPHSWPSGVRPVIGMLHVPALPGSPRAALSLNKIMDHVTRDAEALTAGGAMGLLLENFGDAPYFPRSVPAHTVAQLTRIANKVRRVSSLPLGINVLRNDGCAALSIAHAVGARFIRVNILCGARLTDQGLIEGIAHDLLRLRKQLHAQEITILADVDVKHSAALAYRPIADEVADLVRRGGADGLIVTGSATGSAPDPERLAEVQAAAEGRPVFVGSGVTPENVGQYTAADGFIVGTGLKSEGSAEELINPLLVQALVSALGK